MKKNQQMQTELTDWIFATHDLVEPHDYCTRELARFRALTDEQQAAERAADEAEADRLLDALLAERRKEQEALRDAAQAEWIAFNGAATTEQIDGWKQKYARLYIPFSERLNPVTVLPFSAAPSISPTWKSAADLMRKTFAPVQYVVPKYVAEGCTLLAGRPKIGKSWLTEDMALAVAAGGEVLGEKVEQGDVLLLGLEDNERRLQSRFRKILGPFRDMPAGLTYATAWPRVDEGGLDQIRAWIAAVKKPRLIVVDVLARVRSQQQGRQAQYEADYQAIAGLQAIASEKRVALVIVHHLRKGATDSGDAIDKISGTLGLSGAADSVLILDRDGQGVSIYGRGRDTEEIEMAIVFDRGLCRWRVLGQAGEVRKSDERRTILDALNNSGSAMTRADIAEATGMKSTNVGFLLSKMMRAGEIMKAPGGGYLTVPPLTR